MKKVTRICHNEPEDLYNIDYVNKTTIYISHRVLNIPNNIFSRGFVVYEYELFT